MFINIDHFQDVGWYKHYQYNVITIKLKTMPWYHPVILVDMI